MPQSLANYLDTRMRAEVKVKLGGVTDADVNNCTSRNIATLANFISRIFTEKSKIG